jgi:hypothetical protein
LSNLREAFSATALANLDWSEIQEKAIDRVAASGKATTLGISLWKARYQLESRAYQTALKQALEAFCKRYRDRNAVAEQIVAQAMREYIDSCCKTCNGVGEMVINDLRVVCDACAGSKVHRYSDRERAERMTVSYAIVKHSVHKINWLLGQFYDEDRRLNYLMCWELERLTVV